MKNQTRGITLIALVITIIVLIILASVAIYLSLGNNGIFMKAEEAEKLTSKQEATDIINLKITTVQMNKYVEKQEMPTLKELSEVLKDDNEIQYVTEKSQIASTKYEVGENPTSIFTKLNQYPYEFEINDQLQLASINGIKIANDPKNDIEINSENLEIIGTNVGKNIVIPAGYRYVIVTNGYTTTGGTDTKTAAKLASNTNSTIFVNKDCGYYGKYNYDTYWVIFARIEDISKEATFTMNGSDLNLIIGIK